VSFCPVEERAARAGDDASDYARRIKRVNRIDGGSCEVCRAARIALNYY
jgi:hypothetical protein